MKRIVVVIYFLLNSLIYGNYLISNNEIVLFYDNALKSVAYLRNDITSPIDISRVEPMLILDDKELIDLKKYLVKSSRITRTNILKLEYSINNTRLFVYVFPSLKNPKNLYFICDLSEYKGQKNIDLMYHIVPEKDNLYISMHESGPIKYTSYGNISFLSGGNNDGLFITRNSVIDNNKITEPAKASSKLYRGDNLYYVINNVNTTKNINFIISFAPAIQNVSSVFSMLDQEENYWRSQTAKNDTSPITTFSLNHLRLLMSRKDIPNEVSRNIGKETPISKASILFTAALFNINFNEKRFFDDISVRKSDVDYVRWFIYFFKYLDIFKKNLDSNFTDTLVVPQVLSLSDRVDEDGSIINGRDYAIDYFLFYKLLDIVSTRPVFANDRDLLLKRKELVKNYLIKNYYISSKKEFKSRRIDKNTSFKNITFYEIFSKEVQIATLRDHLKKYRNKTTGLLKSKNEDFIDIEYNLEFLLNLYMNGLISEGDSLRKSLEDFIKEQDYCIVPKLYLNSQNYPGIYSDLLHLYLLCIYIRGDGYVY